LHVLLLLLLLLLLLVLLSLHPVLCTADPQGTTLHASQANCQQLTGAQPLRQYCMCCCCCCCLCILICALQIRRAPPSMQVRLTASNALPLDSYANIAFTMWNTDKVPVTNARFSATIPPCFGQLSLISKISPGENDR
jgi:ABC-type Fe3+ transport system permease subunit